MTKKKVKLAFISNDSSRKTTYKKRKKGLIKKVNKLSTLCGIRACAIIYSPYDTNPEIWPSNSGVKSVILKFSTLPEMDQHKKMMDQESFLRQRIAKATEQLRRQIKENRELEMTEVMLQSLKGNMRMFHMNILDLNDLSYLIEQYLKDINRNIEISRNSGVEMGESSNDAVADTAEVTESLAIKASITARNSTINEVGSSSSAGAFFNPVQQQQHHQQFRHPAAPPVGLYEQHQNLSQNHNQSQQQWFIEIMNHPEQMRYAAEQNSCSFMDGNHNYNLHYHHHQPQHQQQQILDDSSTAPVANSSSIIPVTSPNPTNNIWFH